MSTLKRRRHFKESEKGMATVEALPLLIVFFIFTGYGIGMFGVVHTGILHSIAARTYAFETFRHRTNLNYFRENKLEATRPEHYASLGVRLHGVQHESARGQYAFATERPIAFGYSKEVLGRDVSTHERLMGEIRPGERAPSSTSVNPVWIKVQYGICINSQCGQQ